MIYTLNDRRVNIAAPLDLDNVRYPNMRDAKLRERLGVVEVEEPAPPADYSPDTYFRMEVDRPPYVIYEAKPAAQIAAARAAAVTAYRDNLIETGGLFFEGVWYQTDRFSVLRLLVQAAVGGKPVEWDSLDGQKLTLTPARTRAILIAVLDREQAIRAVANTKMSDNSPIADGWPPAFAPVTLP